MSDFNKAQRIVADNYAGGEYARLTKLDECRDVGDTLFTFLMIELSDGEDCWNLATAEQRASTAAQQVNEIAELLRAAADEEG